MELGGTWKEKTAGDLYRLRGLAYTLTDTFLFTSLVHRHVRITPLCLL